MPIIVNLDVVLAQRKIRLNDLAAAVDITVPTCIHERAKGATPVNASAIAAS